jgi:hypothetical protein
MQESGGLFFGVLESAMNNSRKARSTLRAHVGSRTYLTYICSITPRESLDRFKQSIFHHIVLSFTINRKQPLGRSDIKLCENTLLYVERCDVMHHMHH